MNPKELEESYQNNKEIFHSYIDNIKRKATRDIYTVVNPTLSKNPYASIFPKSFFKKNIKKVNKTIFFCKIIVKYYLKNLYLYFSFCLSFLIFKIVYKKRNYKEIITVIDVFSLVDNINHQKKFNENYLIGVYDIFDKFHKPYRFLLRLYGIGKNPFKLIDFFNVINKDKRDFVFDYELFAFTDFIRLFLLMLLYPFKTLRLIQKDDDYVDHIFNYSLISDIQSFNIDCLIRYITGKKIAKINTINCIYSWSEFQVIERSFNYGIRTHSKKIKIIAIQFYLNYETYFNSYVDDLDFDMYSSPHVVLTNGKYYVQDRKNVKYATGVALRYNSIFEFKGIREEKHVLLLGSYIEVDTKYMLKSVQEFDNVIFKNHPAVNINKFGKLPSNISLSSENIYKLFQNARLVIGTASGTSLEAVACGVSVIIIASQDNLTANPLVTYGKGKIWDIAFTKDDVKRLYNKLIKYRTDNRDEIQKIASWYKENFFIEPTEENIVKVFDLDKE